MIRLYYANRLERLADALAENLADGRANPLVGVPIVVPNQAITHYLKVAIAARNGIAANLDFAFLRRFLTDLGAAPIPDEEAQQVAIVHRLYDDELLARPELAPVRRYLDAAGADDVDRDRRRVGLAGQLARLFDAYALERPDRLRSWRRGDEGESATERWQRALYLSLDLPDPLRAAADGFVDPPEAAHFFDVSMSSGVLLSILERLAKHTTLHVYALNPCLEYWEDVRTVEADKYEPLADADTPALRLWGRPGRESVRMLTELAQADFDARFDEPDDTSTLLRAFSKDVLIRAPERVVEEERPTDDSIVLHACTGVRRELEMIAEQIWTLVERSPDDAPLRFNEIAVVLAGRDQDAYRAHIASVFEEHGGIPHHVMDVPLTSSSRIVEAVLLLCALPYSRFTRQDLLRLVTHPAVLARQEHANADEWMSWCDALAVVHGADHRDHAGTYIERDLYNWDQGLKRLALGAFMAGARSGEMRAYEAGGQSYLVHEVGSSELAGAARFTVLVRSLIADARFAATEKLPIARWCEFLHAYVTTYVGATNEQEERDLARVLGTIEDLADLDRDGLEITFGAMTALLEARLESMTTNTGRPLAQGVVVAPLSLAYALPFRVVFMPGLGEGRFPASERTSALDLFEGERRMGKVTPRERDQYWFFTRLLATSEAAHLSWVAKRPETGDEEAPAPTVVELAHLLERNYLGPAGAARLVERHPLRRWDDVEGDRPFVSPSAIREAEARSLRDDLSNFVSPAPFPSLATILDRTAPTVRRDLVERMRLVDPPPPPPIDPTERPISLHELYAFLEDPLQGWARVVLRLAREESDDVLAVTDERFGTRAQIRDSFLRRVFLTSLRDPNVPIEACYEEAADRMELSGELPTGIFGSSERARHLQTLAHWKRELRRASRKRGPIDPIHFGRATEHELVAHRQPTIPIAVEGGTVELFGKTQARVPEPSTSMVFFGRRPKPSADQRYELRGFLDHVVLAATNLHDGPHTVQVSYADGDSRIVKFAPITRDEARRYLGRLVSTLMFETHAYALPFDTVVQLKRRARGEHQRILDDAKASRHGPLREPLVKAPPLERAEHIVEERYGLYFERREEGP